MLTTAIPNKGP